MKHQSAAYIEWLDATQEFTYPWVALSETEGDPTDDMKVWSVGFVLRETDTYLWLAHSITGADSSPFIVIPKSLVRRRVALMLPAGKEDDAEQTERSGAEVRHP